MLLDLQHQRLAERAGALAAAVGLGGEVDAMDPNEQHRNLAELGDQA